MLIWVATATWWLLVSRSVALPLSGYDSSSSSAVPVVIDSDFGSSSISNETSTSASKDNSRSGFVGSANSTAGNSSAYNPGTTRVDNWSATNTSGRYNTSPSSSTNAIKTIPGTSDSTPSGYTSRSTTTRSTTGPEYALSFAEMLSAITAEFVFNVAGDHILFPVTEDRDEDQRLHQTAVVVAELLQRLHIGPEVYQILNTTSCAVAKDMKKAHEWGANPVAKVMQLTVEAVLREPQLRDEYRVARLRLANRIYSPPTQHGKFASTKSQTLYDVTAEQQAYAERLMEDTRVKRLITSVTFLKASQFEEVSVPEWVRAQTRLARATFELAKQPKWRDEVQRVFDEAVADTMEKFDAMAGDDELIFQALRGKIEKNVPLNAELQRISSQFAQTKT